MKAIAILCILTILLSSSSCTQFYNDQLSIHDNTLYPSSICSDGQYLWCVVPGTEVNGIRYYNTVSDSVSSLCTDPICDHANNDCILFMLYHQSLIVHDGLIFTMSKDLANAQTKILCYDFDNGERKDILTIDSYSIDANWCISDSFIYYNVREDDTTTNIYRISVEGGKSEKVTENTDRIIERFKAYNGDIYWQNNYNIYKNGDIFLSLETTNNEFTYFLHGDYFYYTVNKHPIEVDVNDERYAYYYTLSHKVDLYRISLNDETQPELVLSDILGSISYKNGSIYYLPFYDMAPAFSYISPSDGHSLCYHYNTSHSTLKRYHLDDQREEMVFQGKDILLGSQIFLTDKYIIAYCVPYADAEWIDEEAREVDSYFYVDNADYYKLTYDGEVVGRVGFYENDRGSIK